MQDFKKFVIWEKITRDSIDVKKCYIDIAGGDVVTGILLSQILFWFLPNSKNQSKIRIFRDGRPWIKKERGEW